MPFGFSKRVFVPGFLSRSQTLSYELSLPVGELVCSRDTSEGARTGVTVQVRQLSEKAGSYNRAARSGKFGPNGAYSLRLSVALPVGFGRNRQRRAVYNFGIEWC